MRRAILLILLVSGVSNADDPFACVAPDVADAFLGNWYQGRPEYSTSVPDGFTHFDVPAQMSLVGSQISGPMTTVVYKTSMDADLALSSAVTALSKSGWVAHVDQHRSGMRGFQTRSRPATAVVCHEDEADALSVIANNKSGKTLVSFVRHSESQGCGGETVARPHHDPSDMMTKLPALNLPNGVKASNTGMGGSGDDVSSRVDISGAMGRSELQSYFEHQIRGQNWEYQTSWSSHRSSGSVWTLDTAEDGFLIGTLHLFDAGADPIRVRFSVNPADPAKGTDRGSWGSTSY